MDYTWNKPEFRRQWGDVTIAPTGEPAPTEADGDINLFVQASQVFGQLNASNVFTASTNTFQRGAVVNVTQRPPSRISWCVACMWCRTARRKATPRYCPTPTAPHWCDAYRRIMNTGWRVPARVAYTIDGQLNKGGRVHRTSVRFSGRTDGSGGSGPGVDRMQRASGIDTFGARRGDCCAKDRFAGPILRPSTVDYNSLFAELWASVRDIHNRLDIIQEWMNKTQ